MHVIGPNGSGKSTLLAAMSGLQECAGEVLLQGSRVSDMSLSELASKRGYLAQQARPAFAINVHHFLSLSIPATAPAEAVSPAIAQICQRLKIADKLQRSVNQLSGGEWQRVRLAGLCIQIWPSLNPYSQLLILDEPAAPLDIGQESMLYDLIQEIASMGISIVMANHDLNRALRHASRVLLLQQGVSQGFGSPDVVMQPELLSKVYETKVERVDLEGRPYLFFG